MFPHYAEMLWVERWDSMNADDSAVLAITPKPAYLVMNLNVYNAFWTYPKEQQREKVIHELVHALHADVINFDRNEILAYVKRTNPELYDYLYRSHNDRVEAFTQHMAFGLERMLVAAEGRIARDHD